VKAERGKARPSPHSLHRTVRARSRAEIEQALVRLHTSSTGGSDHSSNLEFFGAEGTSGAAKLVSFREVAGEAALLDEPAKASASSANPRIQFRGIARRTA